MEIYPTQMELLGTVPGTIPLPLILGHFLLKLDLEKNLLLVDFPIRVNSV
jgi:hypothetical protein